MLTSTMRPMAGIGKQDGRGEYSLDLGPRLILELPRCIERIAMINKITVNYKSSSF